MDGSMNQSSLPTADAQPDYPPLAQDEDPNVHRHQHHAVAAALAADATSPAGYAHQAPSGGVGGAMSALTAAAAAAKPAAPPSSSSSRLATLRSPASLVPTTVARGVPAAAQPQRRGGPQAGILVPPNPNPQHPPTLVATAPVAALHAHHQSSLGKVVESGHEHTGRWTKEEHEAFLAALQLYGKEWKKVAARVKTRTVVQTRTHAQKYFQKLQKVLEAGGEKEASTVLGMVGGTGITLGGSSPSVSRTNNLSTVVDLGVSNSSEKKASKKRGSRMSVNSAQKKQHQLQQQQYHQPSALVAGPSPTTMSRSNSATAAALLNMSNDRRMPATSTIPPTSTGSAVTDLYSSRPNGASSEQPQQHQQHGFTASTGTAAASSVIDTTLPAVAASSAHGFGYPPTTDSAGGSASASPLNSLAAPRISIVAPTHEDMVKTGKYPEPSPAACGKRKLAEIAAAQMLAGVVGAAVAKQGTALSGAGAGGGPLQKRQAGVIGAALEPVIMASNPDPSGAAAVASGEKAGGTPPPPFAQTGDRQSARTVSAGVGTLSCGGVAVPPSTTLHIVNPDSLVDQHQPYARRRLINGQASPSTPWDGQLEALVSQVKSQETPQDPVTVNDAASAAATASEALSTDAEIVAVLQPDLLPPPLRSPRTALQQAICNGSVAEVSQVCIALATSPASSACVANERDDAGFHPLHSVAALGLLELFGPRSAEAAEICRLLLGCDRIDTLCRDTRGNSPVHWAARAGHVEVLSLLLVKGCPLDAPNDMGETALHWAMRAGEGGMGAVRVLVENGARVNVFNRSFRRPLDVAAKGFDHLEEGGGGVPSSRKNGSSSSKVDRRVRRSTRWNLMHSSSQCRTLVLHHHECLDHLAKSDHDWEVPGRIDSIMSTLAARTAGPCDASDGDRFSPCEVTVTCEFDRATLELLSRIHSAEYLAFVNDLSKELERRRKQQLVEDAQSKAPEDCAPGSPEKTLDIVPFTPMVQRKVMKDAKTKEDNHSDTAFSAGSLKAARRAAGAVQHAVDCVLVGRNRNAFCIIRPPGHHAGINGLLSDAESCGFCLFNNVAAGAMHALSDEKHRPRCERCAIVDIDAHHGNGTEEIVRKCHDSGRLLFFSVHIYDHDKPRKGQEFRYKFYPGTGAEDDVAHNIINVPIAPLWREKEVVRSISLASNGGTVEPRQTRQRSKEEAAARRVPSLPDLNKYNNNEPVQASSLRPSGGGSTFETTTQSSDSSKSSRPRLPLPSASPHYPPHYLMGVGRLAYRRAIQHRLLPALRAFNPDLIILSTGFDAARGDVGNARHFVNGTEAMGLDLEPEDYAWTARKVCEVADICCNGRVVSVLEGGYGRTPPHVPAPPLLGDNAAEASGPAKQKLDKLFFSECAIQHLKGLVDPYCAEDEEEQQGEPSIRKHP